MGALMSNPFDFSDFGPPMRSGAPGGPPGIPGAAPSTGGFDPWAGQPQAPAQQPLGPDGAFGPAPTGLHTDAFGQSGSVAGVGTLRTSGPPLVWFAVALGLAVLGAVVAGVGAILGPWWTTALLGWLLAGPVAIGALAVYTRVDTRRRTEAIYSAPGWTSTLYWVVLAACLLGIAVSAWQIALLAGRW
jgi:hypothetical protein